LESDWRFSVWQYGIAYIAGVGSGRLAARIRVETDPPIVLTDLPNALNQALFYELPGKDHPDEYKLLAPAFKLAHNFPYGFDVS